MEINFVLLFVIAAYFATGETLRHNCIHDQIAKKYPKTYTSHLRKESADGVPDKRQTGGYLPYRIAVYYATENITNSSVIPMLNDSSGGFQLAINYLQRVLSVIRASRNVTFPSDCTNYTTFNNESQCTSVKPGTCGDYTVPVEHLETIMICDPTCREVGGGVDADFILYVGADDSDCEGGTLAYAFACLHDDNNNRPLAGYTNICPAGLEFGTQALSFFQLMLHEILHALGFSAELFESFANENGTSYSALTTLTINGANVSAINSPKVLSYGREYYNCPNLEGVLLENEGGDGSANSHWESKTTSYEVMTAASEKFEADFSSISNFTLLLLEDAGWYKVDYATAESLYNYEYLWGKGLGCDFVTGDCDSWAYSCSPPNADGCSYDYQAEAQCRNSQFTDGCFFFTPFSDTLCNSPRVPITNSCFPIMNSNDVSGECSSRECYRHTETQNLFYTVGSDEQLCPYDDAALTFSDGRVLTCPSAELICSRNTPILPFDSTSNIPPSWCHEYCATCSRPASPAHCSTCSSSLTLRGTAPSVCTTDNCGGGEFLDSSGNCVACATGCRACTGPNNADCMACEDETLYRVTTNQPSSSACVTAAACDDTAISTFGDRTCSNLRETSQGGGGASSIHYHQFLPLLLLMVYSSLYL